MIKTVYNYLVLFATLMMVIGGGIGVFMSTADILFPNPHYQTFEDYKSMQSKTPNTQTQVEKLSENELRRNYDTMVKQNLNNQIVRAKNDLIKSFGWIIIPLPIFVYFQKRNSKKLDT